jgi:hypothetical protein
MNFPSPRSTRALLILLVTTKIFVSFYSHLENITKQDEKEESKE